jgi:hypothetical protein
VFIFFYLFSVFIYLFHSGLHCRNLSYSAVSGAVSFSWNCAAAIREVIYLISQLNMDAVAVVIVFLFVACLFVCLYVCPIFLSFR